MADLYIPIPANETHFPNPYFVSLLSIILGQSEYFRERPMGEYIRTPTFPLFLSFVNSNTSRAPEITMEEKVAVREIYAAAFGKNATADDAARMFDSLPHQDILTKILAAHLTVIGLAVLFVGMRFYVRLSVLTGLKREDWLIFMALICFITSSVISFIGVFPAYRHIYDVSGAVLQIWFRMGVIVFYPLMIGMCLVKLSFLEIYRTMAPSERFVKICWGVAAFLIVGSVAYIIALCLICYPTHIAWTEPLNKTCSHRRLRLNTALSIFYVVTDFIILALPIAIVRRLKYPVRTKIGLMILFFLGALACIFSILRSVSDSISNVDFTWHSVPTLIYSMLEMYIGVICACLPALRNLFVSTASRFKKRLSNTHIHVAGSRRGSRSRSRSNVNVASKRGILKSSTMMSGVGGEVARSNDGFPSVILGGVLLDEGGIGGEGMEESKPGNESSELEELKEEAKKATCVVANGGKGRYDDYDEDEIVIGEELGDSYRRIRMAMDAGFIGGSSNQADLEKGS